MNWNGILSKAMEFLKNGVGSLVLKEIPYSGIAYVTLHDSSFPTEFLQECADFCRAVGAERVYAKGERIPENYPYHVSVLQMAADASMIQGDEANLFPVTVQTLDRWREIYNDRMRDIDNASYMSQQAAKALLDRGDGYFIHRDEELLGIGIASGDRIDCVASVKAGSGRTLVATLVHGLLSGRILLEVASTNTRAIRLYESMGFIKTAEISRWYKIF